MYDLTQNVGHRVRSVLIGDEENTYLDEEAVYTIVVTTNNTNNTDDKCAVVAIKDYLQYLPDQTILDTQYQETQCRTWVITKEKKKEEYLVYSLIAIITLSGVLTIVSNGTVIYVGVTTGNKVFENSILSLAFVDLLTGIICTPLVSVIYYYSRYQQ